MVFVVLLWLTGAAGVLALVVAGLRRRDRHRAFLFERPRRHARPPSSPTMAEWNRALDALAPDPDRRPASDG